MARRKRCKVRTWKETITHQRGVPPYKSGSYWPCENKIKPGTPFCKEHFATHKLVEVKCTGEAHSNPYIDHCMVCLPFWGRYPMAVPKDHTGSEPDWSGAWE